MNRRNFLGKAAVTGGMAFCSCNLFGTRVAKAAPARLPVVVNGKRVKTIDVHSHCMFHEANNLLGPQAAAQLEPNINGTKEVFIAVEERLKAMDSQAVDMEVLSVNPFWFTADRDVAAKICDINNQKMAEITHAHPDRFAAFASLALQDPQLAAQQLEKAMKTMGMKGAAIGDVVGDDEFSNPKFDPVWQKAEELGAVLFIHPQGVPALSKRLQGNGWLTNTVAYPLGTTIALQHLIFDGTLDKFPGLKVLGAHGGGYLPSYAPRDDHACSVAPVFCNPNIKLKKKPTEYLRQIYVDALVFTPEALRHLAAQVGPSQIMLGSDYPYPWELHPVDAIMATTSLSEKDRAAILGGNAARVMGIKG
ncbi:MAG TPA: amidohydrolase family protein [Rhodopila sp.]|uniref:amidohydrolase family protein n=1 Tax=Rhodopila sp. TaxID=2480087 RepID=UPI002B64317E|nr:amidohydrolase family protein [Rhodopila sp.]HVY14078.1 amidohydrolase family protein [Rhodopila sp.]